jgi:hypothetical protein
VQLTPSGEHGWPRSGRFSGHRVSVGALSHQKWAVVEQGPLQLLQTQMRGPYMQMSPSGVHAADIDFASSIVGGQSPLGSGGHAPPPPSQPLDEHCSVSLQ